MITSAVWEDPKFDILNAEAVGFNNTYIFMSDVPNIDLVDGEHAPRNFVEGAYALYFEGTGLNTVPFSLVQRAEIALNAVYLKFRYQYDGFTVTIDGLQIHEDVGSLSAFSNEPREAYCNVTAFAGKTVELKFSTYSAGLGIDTHLLDSVEFVKRPSLSVSATNDHVVLRWSTELLGYELETSDGLNPSGLWRSVAASLVTNATEQTVVVEMPGNASFYRLASPSMPFRNLSFDEALTNRVYQNRGSTADLLPGWQLYHGNILLTNMTFNSTPDLSSFVSLVDSNQATQVVTGLYGVEFHALVQDSLPYSLRQRGDVPPDANFLKVRFMDSRFSLKINGRLIFGSPPIIQPTPADEYYYDVSTFAGQKVDLELSTETDMRVIPDFHFLDGIEFVAGTRERRSTSSLPDGQRSSLN